MELECWQISKNTTNDVLEQATIKQGEIRILGLELNKTSTRIDRDTSEDLEVAFKPEGIVFNQSDIQWKSDDESIATVDNTGKVTAQKIGNTTITASLNGVEATCDVEVYASLKSISLNKNETTINKGNNETLTVTYNPEDTTDDKTVTWSSSDETIATVDNTGKVTAKKAGTATITATVGEFSDTCEVTCKVPLESITLNKSEIELNKGENDTLTVTYNPTDTTDDKTVTYSSSDETVVTVDNSGKVTAVGGGDAVITATVGTKTDTCHVIVYVPLQSISMTRDSITLPEKQSSTRKIIYNPEDTTDDKTVVWSSSDESIAIVNSNGKVTAKAPGTAIVTAQVGSFTTTYTITVSGIIGDIDGDNMVTAFDSYKAMEESNNTVKTEDYIFMLDVDGDEIVSAFDAYKILEKSVGIDSEYWK